MGTASRMTVDDRRAQLVATGLELFGSRAFDDIAIDDIAAAAGVSRGLLYHYFPSKRDLYVEVVREVADDLFRVTEQPADLPAEERVRGAIDAYLDYVDANARTYCMVLRGGVGSDEAVQEIVDASRARFLERTLSELADGRTDAAARAAVRGWIGFVEGACLDWLAKRELSREQLAQLLSAALGASLEAAAEVV